MKLNKNKLVTLTKNGLGQVNPPNDGDPNMDFSSGPLSANINLGPPAKDSVSFRAYFVVNKTGYLSMSLKWPPKTLSSGIASAVCGNVIVRGSANISMSKTGLVQAGDVLTVGFQGTTDKNYIANAIININFSYTTKTTTRKPTTTTTRRPTTTTTTTTTSTSTSTSTTTAAPNCFSNWNRTDLGYDFADGTVSGETGNVWIADVGNSNIHFTGYGQTPNYTIVWAGSDHDAVTFQIGEHVTLTNMLPSIIGTYLVSEIYLMYDGSSTGYKLVCIE